MRIRNSLGQLLFLAYMVFRTLKAHSCRSDGVHTASITIVIKAAFTLVESLEPSKS